MTVDTPPSEPTRWRRLLGPAILEAFLLTLGIALALAGEEWREARQHRQRARAAAVAIGEELRTNRAAVASAAAYHSSLMDTLRRILPSSPPPDMRLFNRGFVAPAPVASGAWQTASETGVLEHIPHAVVLKLSRVYGPQARYERQAEIVGGLVYGELYRGGAGGIAGNHRNLSFLLGAFLYRERQLLALYDSTIAVLSPVAAGR